MSESRDKMWIVSQGPRKTKTLKAMWETFLERSIRTMAYPSFFQDVVNSQGHRNRGGRGGQGRPTFATNFYLFIFGALYMCAMPARGADLGHQVPRTSSVVGRGLTTARET